ncbi:uncharacterized protein SCHCODRAFT_02626267 [Schizophyllum commune H4-8]|uniref:Uncharacterized protein n=1 Tax=Schizophyllum commune (strain H4-8 / FGSC 9210) TaxID=578458 RepID=D8Q4S9_SCHCM|nr:uncharacterized protein SCHCODRAFT_02626267 [Schizophyllum commune H4-8]KAI5892485.1 hypothetical protein SCHCODRAFT_02626267 [Schizophyllum commune H4-8]
MKFLIAAASLIAAVQALTINTPSGLTACQPSLLSWSDGTAPFFLTILPGGQTSGALKSFDQTDATSITWNVDIASGTSITLSIKDSTGNIAYTDAVTIAKGSNEDCVNGDATASGQTGSAAATSGGSSATSGGSSASTTKASGSSSGGSGSSASSTASSSESSGSNAASARAFAAPAGLAGVLGLVGAALF